MISWTREWSSSLLDGGAFYVWGGIGSPEFRPFLRYLHDVEEKGKFELANLITWKKKRGYGVQNNYLFTREECAYFIKGNAKKPRKFNIPLLEEKRGYAGYNKNYPAKSEFFRRTNVWTDINEIFQGKVHPTQKTQRLFEVIMEIHTDPGDWVIDPFAGAGTLAFAARKLGRKFVIIEKHADYFETLVKNLRVEAKSEVIESPQETQNDT
jgi:site-specific DNA-methyltransferase (adenine-specific)